MIIKNQVCNENYYITFSKAIFYPTTSMPNSWVCLVLSDKITNFTRVDKYCNHGKYPAYNTRSDCCAQPCDQFHIAFQKKETER